MSKLKKILNWIFHNLFLKLWLVFGGIIGISTSSTCPCCGQSAAACPAGFSIMALLAGILALLGVFRKRIAAFFRNFFIKSTPQSSQPRPFISNALSGWILFFLVAIVILILGDLLFGKTSIKQDWRPGLRTVEKQSLVVPGTARTVPPEELRKKDVVIPAQAGIKKDGFPTRQEQAFGNNIPLDALEKVTKVQAAPPAPADKTASLRVPVPAAPGEPFENAELPQQMRAVINPDGSVEMQKNLEGMIRYETWNFMELNDDIYERINVYRGKKFQIEGYVYRRKDFEPGHFVTARSFIWCCAFDAAPVGPLCKWDRADEFKDGDWVRVEGTIEPMFFNDTFEDASGDIPLIKVEKVERIKKLENPYVYLRNKNPSPQPGHKRPG